MAGDGDAAGVERENAGEPKERLVGGLVVVLGLVAPLGVALGTLALTGTVGRIQRNAMWQTIGAYTAVVVGSGLWALGSFKWKKLVGFKQAAVAFTVAGTIIALWAAIFTAGRQPRPRISVSLDAPHKELSVSVSATGLKTSDRLAISVDALKLQRNQDPKTAEYETVGETLYQGYVGPDPDGNVIHRAVVKVPGGEVTAIGVRATTASVFPACNDREEANNVSGTGCVITVVR
jgi:hypothetical protein